MKTTEILDESFIHSEIRKILERKGYKFLGRGVDQAAFLAPDGMILKIFGTEGGRNVPMALTPAQETFKAFADFCRKNPNNPFLPNFTDWATFEFKGKPYLQIKMERLFPFTGKEKQWADILDDMALQAGSSNSARDKKEFIDDMMEFDTRGPAFLTHLGEDGFNLLWNTIYQLGNIAHRMGITLDLHGGNFLLGSDGHIVISDPFLIGWGGGGGGGWF